MQELSSQSVMPKSNPTTGSVNCQRVLLQFPNKKNNFYTFHLPVYVRLEIKNFVSISLQELKAKINSKIMVDIDQTQLPPKLKKYLKSNIVLKFNEDPPMPLTKGPQVAIKTRNMKNRKENLTHDTVGFRIQKQLSAKIIPQIFWTPYQKLILVSSVSLPFIDIQEYEEEEDEEISSLIEEFNKFLHENGLTKNSKKQSKFQIRFNIMKYDYKEFQYTKNSQKFKMMSMVLFSHDTSFGNYDLAENLISVQYSNQEQSPEIRNQQEQNNFNLQNNCCYKLCCEKDMDLNAEEEEERNRLLSTYQKRKDNKIISFNTAHFQIPIYRKPIVALLTIFAPVWFLGIISLAIFFQSSELADRIASIATVMLAFVAFMPVIRAELPPTPKITFTQILIYLEILISFLCLVESIRILDLNEDFDWKSNPLFLICLSIQIFETLVILISIIVFYYCLLPSYNSKKGLSIYFDIGHWGNQDCCKHYDEKIKAYEYEIQELHKKILT